MSYLGTRVAKDGSKKEDIAEKRKPSFITVTITASDF